MGSIVEKFAKLGTDHAPGQEVRQGHSGASAFLRGDVLEGPPVDFSHGDVDAHTPIPGAFEAFAAAVASGGAQAYTEYRGSLAIRQMLAARLAAFTGRALQGDDDVIITPGTQGALFLAVACTVARGTKVAIVQPDYFANRKLVEFFDGEMMPVRLDYLQTQGRAGLDLTQLEDAFRAGAEVFLFSNPNNPVGVIYSAHEIQAIARLATRYSVTVIVDELYSRLLYEGSQFTHLRAQDVDPDRIITILGPSKTESMSGYRVGVAFGAPAIIRRMEQLQAIVSLRAAGYNQAVLKTWFAEPDGWLQKRIVRHQAIRDALLSILRSASGLQVRTPEAGSYVFPQLPALAVSQAQFVQALRVQAGVTVTIGTEFSPRAVHGVRFNFSQEHQATVRAAERVVQMIARYRQ